MLFANGKLMIYVLTRGLASASLFSELQAACPSGPAGAPGRAVSPPASPMYISAAVVWGHLCYEKK